MNAHSSLAKYRIIVLPGKRLLLYKNPKLRNCPGMLTDAPPLGAGTYAAIRTKDDWLIVAGKGGLPLRKALGLRAIEDLFDHEVIDLEHKVTNGSWAPVDQVE